MPTADQMNVKVVDALAAMAATVDHTAVSLFGEPFGLRDACGGNEHRPHEFRVLVAEFGHGADVPFRNQEDVHRPLGIDVPKGQRPFVTEDLVAGDLAGHEIAE